MAEMVNVFLFGKKYSVPSNLTIMRAMEYAGYSLVRGCGCRNGFCGACATVYRIKGDRELKVCLACQTKVEENMYVATLPFFPLVKQVYDINEIKPEMVVIGVLSSWDTLPIKLRRILSSFANELVILLNEIANSPISSSLVTGILREKSPCDMNFTATDILLIGFENLMVREYNTKNTITIGIME